MITYTDDPTVLRDHALDGFFEGWPTHPDRGRHRALLARSAHVWFAVERDDDDDAAPKRVVGFVNAITDGTFYAFIPLLEVVPERRGQGIGVELVRRMLETLESMYAVDVICDESVAPFYERLGLRRCVGMVHRNFDRQAAPIGTPRVVGVHHAQITIPRDREADARAFYVDTLGLSEIAKPASLTGRGGFWLRAGRDEIHVGTEDDVDRTLSKAHLAYEVEDLAAWRTRLESAGIECESGIPIPGHARFECRDPFGNRVELIERV